MALSDSAPVGEDGGVGERSESDEGREGIAPLLPSVGIDGSPSPPLGLR